MKKFLLGTLLALLSFLSVQAAQAGSVAPQAYVIRVQQDITPASADFIHAQLKKAAAQNANVFVIELDTPGGLMDSMKKIVQDIIASPVPVVTYVGPSGAHAASAGTYIMYAGEIAAMAPGTNLGAATPIMMGQPGAKPQSVLEKKIASDASAYIRSLADMRGRNAGWAAMAVNQSVSLTASEALKKHVINVMADNIPDLLKKIDGTQVKVGEQLVTLRTAGAAVTYHKGGWRAQLLAAITDPNITYLLMIIGFWGIIIEFSHPGAIFPGITGAVCILLWLYAMNILPVNYTGVALILLGLSCMTAEAFMPTIGVLGVGGAAAFAIGSVLMFNVPGFSVSYWLIGLVTLLSLGFLSFILAILIKDRTRPSTVGPETMVGITGKVVEWNGKEGAVHVNGALWKAESPVVCKLQKGDKVKVTAVNGLCITIEPNQSVST